MGADGQVAERLIAPVLKTGERESVPGVRIPPCPPLNFIDRVRLQSLGTLPAGSYSLEVRARGTEGGCNTGVLTAWGADLSVSRN